MKVQSTKELASFPLLKKIAKWFLHLKADIAIHPLVYTQEIDQLSFPVEPCVKEDEDIPLLSTVYVLGFPLGLGVQKSISPIAKKLQTASKVISVDNPEINPDLKYMLLDQAIAQVVSVFADRRL